MNLLFAFITGLTAGGLGCLAVQGGLMTSALAHQFEKDLQFTASRDDADNDLKCQPRIALPIYLFLLSKLLAYTLLGLVLGSFGSLLQLTPLAHAVLMISIGIFMLGNGLRMLKVHPLFRWFVIEPPSVVTRFIRRRSKNGASLATPLLLGALTVLLPCGVAQTVMAAALASGDPIQGAGLMFAFTLGTLPVFFSVAYCATRFAAILEGYFTRIVALILMALGTLSIAYGCNLAGMSVSFPAWINRMAITSHAPTPGTLQEATSAKHQQGHTITVSGDGYSPKVLHLPADRPNTIVWAATGVTCCALSVVIPALDYHQVLPANGNVPLDIPTQKKGTVIAYSCFMGKNTGRLIFDL